MSPLSLLFLLLFTGTSSIEVCCTGDLSFNENFTIESRGEYLPRQVGDLTIMYDVTRTYESNYWAQVTIANHNPVGRLDYWKLSWDWMEGEFIFAMRGATPLTLDTSKCVYGKPAEFYQGLDFSTVLSCEPTPTIIDLPLALTNDSINGMIPFCCRNGTILPPEMDPAKSQSAFLVNVYKMPPNTKASYLTPPQNWSINAQFNQNYKCGPPVWVSPSTFPNPTSLLPDTIAIASWQVVCNVAKEIGPTPNKCCVSFSSYYKRSASRACENYGVTLDWNIINEQKDGWSARITIMNWDDVGFADWFAAFEFKRAAKGFKTAYNFNGPVVIDVNSIDENTLFMKGLPGQNYLMAETGMKQSIIAFGKELTPGINISAGDGFPAKVIFNGEECSLPEFVPIGDSHRLISCGYWTIFIALIVF